MIELAPSLLAANVLQLETELSQMISLGVTTLHFDVMDAHFVPNLSFSPAICGAIKKRFPEIKMDVHLMMDDPLRYLDAFAKAGADEITVHQEVLTDISAAVKAIHDTGCAAGLSVKPGTGAETLLPYLDSIELVLIMTVEPGFGGQKFQPQQIGKIEYLRANGYKGIISVDGGVNLDNAELLSKARANRLVMGTAFFGAQNKKAVADTLVKL